MKDLIVIGAYCPDDEREQLLNQCVDSIQKCKNEYDILICSHTIVPEYIAKKVDYTFYDKKNDLITDLKYLNRPWFKPLDNLAILSTYIGHNSTYLAAYRLLIAGLGFAKMFKYEKIHWVEYDSIMNDLSELFDNSKLLNEYDSVVIQKDKTISKNYLAWPMGNFMSFKVKSIDEILTTYDRERLLEMLLESPFKTNEKITNDVMLMNGNTIYIKNYEDIKHKDIKFELSDNTSKESMSYWTVPFYNTNEDKVFVIVYNNKDEEPINVNFIINETKIINFNEIQKSNWKIEEIGDINDISSILILVNGKIKNNIILNEENRELFKKTNHSVHT
jgi:hypothetical protein